MYMCDRFSFSLAKEKIIRRFGIKVPGVVSPHYNIAPGHTIAIITNQQPQQVTRALWGLKNTAGTVTHQIFVKSTTHKPTVRTAHLLTQRCLILADGFYIWKKMSRKSRVPYRVTLKWGIPFAFAGIWQCIESETNTISCAIIVTEANELIAPIAIRMPVILSLEQEKEWLQPESIAIDRYILPYPSERMRLFPVSAQVNQLDINTPELTLPSQPADQFGNYVLFD